jgi:hypothetical protein
MVKVIKYLEELYDHYDKKSLVYRADTVKKIIKELKGETK